MSTATLYKYDNEETITRHESSTWFLPDVDMATVLVLIKLTKNAVALRLRCGSCKLIF